MPSEPRDIAATFERMLKERGAAQFSLRLYIAGMTPRSIQSLALIKGLCERYLPGRHKLEVINLADHPELAERDDIILTPTLVRELPSPVRRLVGELTDPDRLILVLE